jgi:peptidoglycan-associated lipoprotein
MGVCKAFAGGIGVGALAMIRRSSATGAFGLLGVAAVLLLAPAAQAEERMLLGAQARGAGQFQHVAGDRVFFGNGSAELGARARVVLKAQAQWLMRNPLLPVVVEGHADDTGTGAYNRALSGQRAEAVRRMLVALGVARDRITVVPYGKERVVALCDRSVCAAQNRRAVTVVGASPDAFGPAAVPYAILEP